MAAVTVEDLETRNGEIKARLKEIDSSFEGEALPEDERAEWNQLNEELEGNDERIKELEARAARLVEIAGNGDSTARENGDGYSFMTRPHDVPRGDDIHDLTTVRATSTSPLGQKSELRDRVLRFAERAHFPHSSIDSRKPGAPTREDVQAHIEGLLDRCVETVPGQTARYILEHGSPTYRRAFGKLLPSIAAGAPNIAGLTSEEQRALALSGTGGFPVPVTLDPTIIPTSNSVVNPARAISRVVSITGSNTWNGVTSPAITAARVAEAGAATDNAQTLVQPTATVTKAHCFVPFSVEVAEDWTNLEAEFSNLLQDAKDDEEGAAFVTGVGTTVNPQGFTVGATTTFAASTGLTVTAANVYGMENALPPRFRARSSIVANRGIYNVIRAIDTAGGAALWLYISQGLVSQSPAPGNTGATLIGRPAWEASAMQATVVNASKIMVIGDFNYFLILDRIGMNIQSIPFLFGAGQGNLPTGQQGLYAWWRNTSKVLYANAFVAMTGTT
ncbi:MAG TPA: phage major capsid protein [Thermoanaerobaculia bacterium]|nr:phage major capsid protein [Thermoanaerobaculia bacterium]